MAGPGTDAAGVARRAARRVRTAAEIVATIPAALRALRTDDLPAALRALRPGGRDGRVTRYDLSRALFLGHAVGRLVPRLPVADTRCLTRSLVLSRMLDRRGIPSTLVIGVRAGEDFGAHAWVEVAGHPVLPAGEYAQGRLTEL